MSNPLNSLRKSKKNPLALRDLSTPMSQISAYNNNIASSSNNDLNLNINDCLSPFGKPSDLNSHRNEDLNASISNFNPNNYGVSSKSPLPSLLSNKKSNYSNLSTNKPLLGDIQSSSRVPFKTNIDDSDLLDEATSNLAISNMKRHVINQKNLPGLNVAPNDMELMQIMMKKIKNTEAKCALLERECVEKDRRIQILENKVDLLKIKANAESSNQTIRDLEEKNSKLQDQIDEMENFLLDYGLVWVGDKNELKQQSSGNNEHKKHSSSNLIKLKETPDHNLVNLEFKCDYDLILKNINELNSLTDVNEPKIVGFKNNGVKFETTGQSIQLTLYENGICLYDGPFRSFNDSLTRKFCIDIMDGYFPSELQSKYPDGVPFSVVDKRHVTFVNDKKINSVFKSKGYRLGNDTQQEDYSSNANKWAELTNENIETSLKENPLTVDQFLNKLPSSIIKNGKLIDVRNDLSNLLTNNSTESVKIIRPQNITVIETPVLNELKEKNKNQMNQEDLLKISNAVDDNASYKLTTLRVKSLDALEQNNIYLLKMKSTDTIQNLKDHIKSQRIQNNEFDLASIHPRQLFTNTNMTLEQCDLVPNSNILLIPRNYC